MFATRPHARLGNVLCCFLSYALIISLCAPAALGKEEAAPDSEKRPLAHVPMKKIAQSSSRRRSRAGELILRFREGVSERDKNAIRGARGARRKKTLRGRSRIEKWELSAGQEPEALAAQLRSLPAVELAEPNYLISRDELLPNDPQFSEQWALRNIGQSGGLSNSDISVAQAWETTTGAPTTVVAVIDSGVDFTHPDLQNNQWTNAAENADGGDNDNNGLVDDLHGWDWITGGGNIIDEQGHGTIVAGIIAAQGNNGVGTTGVMWRAALMSLRVLDNTGTGSVADAVEAIDYAVDHGAQVINCSWGTDEDSLALKDAIQRAGTRGVVVVSSAGNSGRDIDATPYYPSSFGLSNQLSVAATDSSDHLASWSNYGATHVTVAAPGVDILTTTMGGGYTTVSGTSASTPMVTGVVGLIKTQRWWLSASGTRAAVVAGARPVAELNGKIAAGGVVNAAGALAAMLDPEPEPTPTPTPTPGGGTSGTSEGTPGPNLPDLDAARNIESTDPVAPAAIRADLCPDCDPNEGDPPPASGSDPYFATARTRPQNETGERGVDLGSRNFGWGLTLVSLPGRAGMDLNIGISYNSLVWTKQGTAMMFNADRGNPTPGFRLGLPTLEAEYVNEDDAIGSYLLVLPSGRRVDLKKISATATGATYESQDGSYVQLVVTYSAATTHVVRTPDGTQYQFGFTVGGYGLNCTRVQDRNGNYISINYANGKVSQMVDALARTVNFNYDPVDGRLSSITQNRGGTVYTWATFGYGNLAINTWWSGLSYLGPQGSIPVLTQIGLGDGTRYNFDYTSWGQVWKIRRHAQDNHLLSYISYNLPLTASAPQTDCPRFTEHREWAQNWNGDTDGTPTAAEEAVTTYSVDPNSAGGEQPAWSHVTTPDGTIYKEFFDTSATWMKGLTTATEVWDDPNPLDSDNTKVKVKWTETEWTQDSTTLTYQKNPRPTMHTVFDSAGNGRREKYTYTGVSAFSLVTDVDEYEVVGTTETPKRRTHATYNLTTPYRNARIIGLVLSRFVYSDVTTDPAKIVSKVDYQYDEAGWFKDAGVALTNHDTAFDGQTTYGGRGNLTSVRRWDASDSANSAKLVESNIGYDSAGSVVLSRDPLGHTTNVDFADSFSTTVGVTTRAYPTKVTPPLTTAEQANDDDFATTTQYNYDTGVVMKTTRPVNNTGGTTGDLVTFADVNYLYDTASRLVRATNAANGAYTRWVYPTSNTLVQQYQTVHSTAEVYTTELLDGAGRVRGASAEHPGSAGLYSGQYVVYDAMGRAVKRSNQTEMTSAWAAAGDDAAAGWKYTLQSYDWQGRPLVTTHVDGTTRTNSYGGCGCAGGEQLTSTDERGRKKVFKKDSLGRLKTVEEYTFGGAVYSTTAYTYDALDHLVGVNQAGQMRTFSYDGHGRLLTRTTPEQGASTYAYNKDDTVQKVTDARGATITFAYNYRRQPTSVTYGVPANVVGLEATPNVTYTYDSAGNRTAMTDGQGTANYHYNSVSQMDWESRTFTGLTGDYKLAYLYNKSGGVTRVTASGPVASFGSSVQVTYVRDKTGKPTSVTGSGYAGVTSYVTGITYRAFGAPKQINYSTGNSLALEYDADLRLTKWDVAGAAFGWDYKYSTPGLQEKTGKVAFADNLYDATLDRSYEYDHVGRLIKAHTGTEANAHAGNGASWGTLDGPYSATYTYDKFGNMTDRDGWGVPGAQYVTHPPYGANNRPAVNPATGSAMSYDAAGNLLSDGAITYTYDATGQQITAGGTDLAQAYDGDGLRVKKTEDGLTTTFYLRSSVLGGKVVAEIGGSSPYAGEMTRGYVYLGEQLLAVQEGREDASKPDRVLWVHQDPVTKSQRLTDSTGAVVSTVDLDPWGGETGRSEFQSQQPRRYTTYERDSDGGDDAMFRRYESKASRFAQPDPYDGSYVLSDPQSFNRYSYTQNDPVNFIDPSGLMKQICGLWGFPGAEPADPLTYRYVCFGASIPFYGYDNEKPREGGGTAPPKQEDYEECRSKALHALGAELQGKANDFPTTGDKVEDALVQAAAGYATGGIAGAVVGAAVSIYTSTKAEERLERGPVNTFYKAAAECDKIRERERRANAGAKAGAVSARPPNIIVQTRQFGTFSLHRYRVLHGYTLFGERVFEWRGPNPMDPIQSEVEGRR